jgi:glutaredoxin
MYVKPSCPYCQAAREHLAGEGEIVEERDATVNSAWKAELMGYTNNRGVVPTIVRDGERVQVGFPPGRGWRVHWAGGRPLTVPGPASMPAIRTSVTIQARPATPSTAPTIARRVRAGTGARSVSVTGLVGATDRAVIA